MPEQYQCVKPSCGLLYEEAPGSCRQCGSDVRVVITPRRVRKKVVKKQRTPIEIQDKTYQMLRDYCQLHGTQIRSEIDGLLQYAITERLKTRT